MTKKILSFLVLSLALASCSNPLDRGTESFDEVVSAQRKAITAALQDMSNANFVGKTLFSADAWLSSDMKSTEKTTTNSGTLSLSGELKSKSGLSSGLVKMDLAAQGDQNAKGSLGLSFAQSGSTVFLRLDSLDLTTPPGADAQSMNMGMTMAKGLFIGNWIKIDPSTIPGMSPKATITPPSIAKMSAIIEKYNTIKLTKDLGYSDGRYHYQVETDDAAMQAMTQELSIAMGNSGAVIGAPTAHFSGTMEVEKANKLHTKIVGNTTVKKDDGTSETLVSTVDIDTGKFILSFSDAEGEFSINLSSSGLNSLSGPIKFINNKSKESFEATLTLAKNGDTTEWKLEGKDMPVQEGKMSFGINGKFQKIADASVQVEMPATFKTIQEIIGDMMGGGRPVPRGTGGGNGLNIPETPEMLQPPATE